MVQRLGAEAAADALTSFPGIGPLTGARVLGEIGDDRARFRDARGLKSYAGSAPITIASGKSLVVHHRKVKNQGLAAAGYVWIFGALPSPLVKHHYDLRRAAGDKHAAAMRNLFNRFLGCPYHCLQTGQTFVSKIGCLWMNWRGRTLPVILRLSSKTGGPTPVGRVRPVLTVVPGAVDENDPGRQGSALIDELVREGARRMLAEALRAEVDAYIARHVGERDENGRRLLVRNGTRQPREVLTSAGAVEVTAPRVNDRRVDSDTGERARFCSSILPPWCRTTPKITEVLPLLYLHAGAEELPQRGHAGARATDTPRHRARMSPVGPVLDEHRPGDPAHAGSRRGQGASSPRGWGRVRPAGRVRRPDGQGRRRVARRR